MKPGTANFFTKGSYHRNLTIDLQPVGMLIRCYNKIFYMRISVSKQLMLRCIVALNNSAFALYPVTVVSRRGWRKKQTRSIIIRAVVAIRFFFDLQMHMIIDELFSFLFQKSVHKAGKLFPEMFNQLRWGAKINNPIVLLIFSFYISYIINKLKYFKKINLAGIYIRDIILPGFGIDAMLLPDTVNAPFYMPNSE